MKKSGVISCLVPNGSIGYFVIQKKQWTSGQIYNGLTEVTQRLEEGELSAVLKVGYKFRLNLIK